MPSTVLSTSASMSSARVDVPGGGSNARSADDTTSSAISVVNVWCDGDYALCITATGRSATVASAHFERGAR